MPGSQCLPRPGSLGLQVKKGVCTFACVCIMCIIILHYVHYYSVHLNKGMCTFAYGCNRYSSPLFRLPDADAISRHMFFHNTGPKQVSAWCPYFD